MVACDTGRAEGGKESLSFAGRRKNGCVELLSFRGWRGGRIFGGLHPPILTHFLGWEGPVFFLFLFPSTLEKFRVARSRPTNPPILTSSLFCPRPDVGSSTLPPFLSPFPGKTSANGIFCLVSPILPSFLKTKKNS